MDNIKINDIVDRQRCLYNSCCTLSYAFRRSMLLKLKESLINNKDYILKCFVLDYNKNEFDAITTEYGMVMMELDYMLKNLSKFMKIKKVKTEITNFPSKGRIYKEPYGVCLIMSPWNYPLQLTLVPLIASIATGNTSVVKPSNYSYNVSLAIQKVLDVFDDEYITTVLGGRDANQALLEQRWDFIFFTGGDVVGRLVMEKASKYLTPVALELGGKSPCIVCDDCNIDRACKRIVWGKFLNAGQTCVAPDYILVQENIKEAFISKTKEYIQKFFYENGVLNEDFPYIINDKHVERLKKLIDKEKLVWGGKNNERSFEPTVLDNVSFDDLVMQEEIFGPIMPIISFKEINEIVDKLHTLDKPLALYLFTNDKVKQNIIMNNVSFGGGCINDCIMHLTNANLPFGGVGKSGMGSYHGKKSFETFSHYKSVLVKNKVEIDLKYPPYTEKKLKIISKIMKCK